MREMLLLAEILLWPLGYQFAANTLLGCSFKYSLDEYMALQIAQFLLAATVHYVLLTYFRYLRMRRKIDANDHH